MEHVQSGPSQLAKAQAQLLAVKETLDYGDDFAGARWRIHQRDFEVLKAFVASEPYFQRLAAFGERNHIYDLPVTVVTDPAMHGLGPELVWRRP